MERLDAGAGVHTFKQQITNHHTILISKEVSIIFLPLSVFASHCVPYIKASRQEELDEQDRWLNKFPAVLKPRNLL